MSGEPDYLEFDFRTTVRDLNAIWGPGGGWRSWAWVAATAWGKSAARRDVLLSDSGQLRFPPGGRAAFFRLPVAYPRLLVEWGLSVSWPPWGVFEGEAWWDYAAGESAAEHFTLGD